MPTDPANTQIVKRSLVISGHRTSVSLEDAFWLRLRRIALERDQSVNALASTIDALRGAANLSSAIRVFVLEAESASPDRPDAPPSPRGPISKARPASDPEEPAAASA